MRCIILGWILLNSISLYSIDIPSAIHYTLDNGLPTNNIHSISQDSLGYIWIATEAGLSRFNGTTFYNYTTKNGLAKNEISDLIKKDGIIFLLSNGPFGYIKDAKINYLNVPIQQKMNWNFGVASDTDNIYLTSQNQIISLSKDDLKFVNHKDLKTSLSLVGTYRNHLYGLNGPYLYKLQGSKVIEKSLLETNKSSEYHYRAIHLLIDNKIFYMRGNDLFSYDLASKKTVLVFHDLAPVMRIRQYDNSLVLIHLNGGITELSLDTTHKVINRTYSSEDIVFTDFLVDNEDNRWYSTVNQGLYFVPKEINGISSTYSKDIQNLESPISLFITGDSIWIGNSNAELILLHNNNIQKFKLPSLNKFGVSRIIDIKELSTGDLIISSDIGILLFINNSFEYIFRTSAKKITVQNKKIIINTYQSSYVLEEDCLYKIVDQKTKFNNIDFENIDCVNELDVGRAYVSTINDNTDIYIAKVIKGLVKIEGNNTVYLNKYDEIYNTEINDLMIWNGKYIVVASAGEGFYFSEIENPENITYVDGVSSNVCYTLLQDNNRIFVGTNKGIYFITASDDIEQIQVQLLSQKHGLLSNEIRDLEIKDNKLFALSNKGLNIINLDELEIYSSVPNLRLETIIVNQKNISIQDTINLEPHENNLSFQYNKIDFSRSDNLNYAYKLIGIDDDWYYTNSTEAKYPNLKSGNYTFQVGIAQEGQLEEEKIQEVHIRIRTAFIDSIWAKLIGVLLFLVASYFILIALLSRRNVKRLEQNVSERTQELNEKVKEIEQINMQLKMSNSELQKYAHIASHDLKSPLRTISSFITLLEKRNLNSFEEKDFEYVNFVKKGVSRMSNTVNDLLELSKVDTKAVFEYADLNQTISNILTDLDFQIKNKNVKIIIQTELPILRMQKTSAYQLFQNLITNAIKYNESDHPSVWIDTKDNADTWIISIKDNGIGIEPAYQKDIFEIFRRLHGNDKYDGTGIGLALCMKIVTKYGGFINIESEFGKGTTFFVELPK